MNKFTNYLANTNFFDKPTFIRKIQCFVFGHHPNTILNYATYKHCAWCSSKIKMNSKIRKELDNE